MPTTKALRASGQAARANNAEVADDRNGQRRSLGHTCGHNIVEGVRQIEPLHEDRLAEPSALQHPIVVFARDKTVGLERFLGALRRALTAHQLAGIWQGLEERP